MIDRCGGGIGRCAVRASLLLAVLVGAAAAGGLLVASPAHAHAELVASEPADGATLPQAPTEVVLEFNEPVDTPPEPLRVFNADGERVDTGELEHAGDRSVLRMALRPDLPDGVYVVAWRVISADTHPVGGSVTFAVGEADITEVVPAVPDEDQPGWDAAAAVVRWVMYAGTLLAAGGVAFLVFAHDRAPVERERLARLVGWAVAAGVAGTVAGIPLQTVLVGGAGAAGLGEPALLAEVVTSGYGASALVRLAGLTVLFVGAVGLGVVAAAVPAALTGGTAALGSFLLAGHTATSEPRLLVWASDLSHTAAAAIWVGGLALLAVVLHRRRSDADAAGGARMVARFSALAVGSVLVVAVAGTAMGWVEVRTWRGLTSTSYGWTLLAKAALAAVVVGIGGYNNRRLVPAIRRGSGDAWRRLMRTVRVETTVLLLGVLALTAVLVNLVPGRQADSAEAGAGGPYRGVHPLGPDHQVELVVDPAQAGTNQVDVFLRDQSGEPADAVERVELRFSLPAAEIDRITREPADTGAGQWRHIGPELSIAGEWEIEVRVTVGDFERHTTTVEVPVSEVQPSK